MNGMAIWLGAMLSCVLGPGQNGQKARRPTQWGYREFESPGSYCVLRGTVTLEPVSLESRFPS